MTHRKHTGPGGELNRKLKDKWEALRRNPHYRRERDTEFKAYVEREIIRVEECKELLEAHMNPLWKPYLRKALLNHDPQVEDFQKWWPQEQAEIDFLFSTQGQKLAIKFGLQLPRHYDDPIWNPEEDPLPLVFYNANYAVEDILQLGLYGANSTMRVIPHADAIPKYINEHERILDLFPHLEAGRFLTLIIDLKNPKTQIMADFEYVFEKYRKLVLTEKKRGVRDKSVDDDIWKIWDMHEKGDSAWQITKKIYPDITSKYPQSFEIDENTEKLSPKNQRARRYLRKVERAIKNAQDKIDSLNPTT